MDQENHRIEKEFLVMNRQGIHARVAAQIVDMAQQFVSNIWIAKAKGSCFVSAKSILDILTLACGQGTKVKVRAEGPDAEEALEALSGLFKKKFGEI